MKKIFIITDYWRNAIRPTLRYPLMPVRMAIIKKNLDTTDAGEDVEK